MKLMNTFAKIGVAGAFVFGLSTQAHALTLTFSDSIALQTTNWSNSVSISKFNPLLGTLNSITFSLAGSIHSNYSLESLDAAPSIVTATSAGTITLKRPDNSTLVAVLPSATQIRNFSAFDGAIDFGGTSGANFGPVVASASNSFTSPPPISDLALFTGVGNILLPVFATANSTATGSGNLLTLIRTQAGADVSVTYDYTPRNNNVPEPGAVAFLATGAISGLGVLARRRRK